MRVEASEKGHALTSVSASAIMGAMLGDALKIKGRYVFECYGADGKLKWTDTIENTIVTVGKNLILDQAFAGSAYTAVEYLGLISSTSYSAISAADTMGSHAGWLESGGANAPTMSSSRGTTAWSAASAGAKALSAALGFNITGTGTIKGGFMVGGSGASATVGSTAGVLISAGLFTGGDRSVISGDVVNASYSVSI